MRRMLRRYLQRSAYDRRLLLAAGVTLAAVRLLLACGAYPRLRRRLSMPPDADTAAMTAGDAARITGAVRAAAKRLRGSTCLAQSLAAQWLIRRRGGTATVRYGIRMRRGSRHARARAPLEGYGARPLDAHAWLEYDGRVLLDADAHERYAPLTQTPPTHDRARSHQ
jgi:hypothetical protein